MSRCAECGGDRWQHKRDCMKGAVSSIINTSVDDAAITIRHSSLDVLRRALTTETQGACRITLINKIKSQIRRLEKIEREEFGGQR